MTPPVVEGGGAQAAPLPYTLTPTVSTTEGEEEGEGVESGLVENWILKEAMIYAIRVRWQLDSS